MDISTSPRTHSSLRDDSIVAAQRGLKLAAATMVITGIFFAIASTATTDAGVRTLLDFVFFRLGDGPSELSDSHHLVNAILGGVMVGWGVMIWYLADRLLPLAPREVARLLFVGLVVWFVVDSAGSIASGGWLNAVPLNVGFLGLFLVPLRHLR
ncbi:MAG: hypothetical protein AAGC53_20490 [Actinomycetota bacterium]